MTEPPANPIQSAQRLARPELPRRFYKVASAEPHEGGFALKLDGRLARTPGKKPLAVADRNVADAIAVEWEAQADRVDPSTMPVTRIANAAIDRVAGEMEAVRAEIVRYAGTDLICYRAEAPQSLIDAEDAAWAPLVQWARETLGARLVLAEGIIAVEQAPETLAAIARALEPLDALTLAAVHVATTLSGSAVIALALHRRRLTAAEAWAAAHVSEDWQMSQWGRDEIALARREARWRDMAAAGLILAGTSKPTG